jgi:8-oxo-dGTP diphosphatase
MSLAGKWEFPVGKVEPGEKPETALAREIKEELGLQIVVGPLLGSGSAHVGSRFVQRDVYAANDFGPSLASGNTMW